MKRAKVMLMAIIILAGVGGALAFKVRNASTFYCVDPANPTTCSLAIFTKWTVDPNGTFTTHCSTIQTAFPCQTTFKTTL